MISIFHFQSGMDFSDPDAPHNNGQSKIVKHEDAAPDSAGHYRELHNFARSRTGDTVLAEDLVQETYLRAVNSDSSELRNMRAFLFRILNNLVTDHFRKLRRTRERFSTAEVPDIAADTQNAEDQLIARQRLKILQEAIDELPPRCRECFILRRFDELSHAEIATRMNITRSAVEKHLAAATAHCTRRMRERG